MDVDSPRRNLRVLIASMDSAATPFTLGMGTLHPTRDCPGRFDAPPPPLYTLFRISPMFNRDILEMARCIMHTRWGTSSTARRMPRQGTNVFFVRTIRVLVLHTRLSGSTGMGIKQNNRAVVGVPPLSQHAHHAGPPAGGWADDPPHHAYRVPPASAPLPRIQSHARTPPQHAAPRPHRDVSAPDAVQYPRERQPPKNAAQASPPEVPESRDLYLFLRPRVGPPLACELWMRPFLPVNGNTAEVGLV